MPRLVPQFRAPEPSEAGCLCCHRRHAEHLPHIGNVSDWSAEQCARLPTREWDQPTTMFASMLEHGDVDWSKRLAHALENLDADVPRVWVTAGAFDVPADRVVWIIPALTAVELKCGVAERFGIGVERGCQRTRIAGPAKFRPNIAPAVLIAYTGLLLVASREVPLEERLAADVRPMIEQEQTA